MVRGTLVAVCAAVLGALLAACGIGDRQGMADDIASAVEATLASPLHAELRLRIELDADALAELEGEQREAFASLAGAPEGEGAEAALPPNEAQFGVTMDRAGERAVLMDDGTPFAFFEGSTIYVRRRNARISERRIWAKLDVAALDDDERPLVTRELNPGDVLHALAVAVHPRHLLELAAGSLAGSTAKAGTEDVAGVSTTRYRTMVSPEQRVRVLDLSDEQVAHRDRVHTFLRTSREVMSAGVWVDEDGRLRQVEIELRQQVTRRRENTVVATLTIPGFAGEQSVTLPSAEQTVRYETLGRLVRSSMVGDA